MSKVSTKPKTLTVRDSYNQYAKDLLELNDTYTYRYANESSYGKILDASGKEVFSYKLYKKILALYYIKAAVKIIRGYAFDLGAGLGNIFLMRQGRNPLSKPRLNKGESFRLKRMMEAEGKEITKDNWKIYYTDEEFTKTAWFKPSYIKHLKFYKFAPSGGQAGKGFKQTMSKAITGNPSLLALYPFVPYRKPIAVN